MLAAQPTGQSYEDKNFCHPDSKFFDYQKFGAPQTPSSFPYLSTSAPHPPPLPSPLTLMQMPSYGICILHFY